MSFKISCISVAVTAALASFSSFAQEQSSDEVYAVNNIERITVTGRSFNDYKAGTASGAMRGDIDLMDTPQSVVVIPSFVTDEQLATNLAEVLTNDSSVTAGSEKWNRQQFSIRGFSLDSGSGFLVNGHQHWSHYIQPTETLEAVEVLKGPSSMLYGQSGPGGLINMVTKKPTYDDLFNLKFDTDEYGSTRFQVDAGGALNEEQTVRYRSMLVKQDATYSSEYLNGENKERDRLLALIALDFDLTDDLTLSVKYDTTSDKTGLDSGSWLNKDGEVIGGRDTIWEMPWAFIDFTVSNIGGDLNWYITDNWQMKMGYNHQMYERQRFASSPTYTPTPELGYDVKPFDRHDDWQYKTAYVDFTGTFSTGGIDHQLLVGANMLDYYYGQLIERGVTSTFYPDQNNFPLPEVNYHNDPDGKSESDYYQYGFYVQDLMTLTDNWKLLLGARYDEQKKDGKPEEPNNNSYAVSPKVGVIFEPTDYGNIYFNYSKSFVPQGSINNVDDVNYGEHLKPKFGTQYEVGTKWELFNDSLLLTAAVFDITVENFLVINEFDKDANGHDQETTQNGGDQNHRGFEMGAQGQLGDSWFMTGSMMYLDAEYNTTGKDAKLNGMTPIDAPKWSANIWTRYEVTEGLALNFGAVYVGERFADDVNTITKDGYVRFDLGAAYQWQLSGTEYSVRMNVQNLFDEEYLGGGSYKEVSIGESRNISLALQAKF
ncbi:TonB-dependent receptor [Shewanella sp. D64]|uniref:TonB-dependent siderophore receptor n=1 Tax=unclassified Shewanella TaxID=196818 RepID=UPI0022BA15C9|nr:MULTISPECIES: TonB-dependent receptor [unclassified Shewanella]MEC4727220.1 TonB-dependent receptor [Shewanella sp. D64]MEC4739163.1 TonB-dependent receptor [Shewanella sp. E94]WBJ95508.1 TonB-dependent receptor [Shewanella sp. MTB7]